MVLEGNTIILLTVFPIVSGNPSFKKLPSHIMHTTCRYPGMHFVFVPPLFCGPQSGQRIWRRSYRLLPPALPPLLDFLPRKTMNRVTQGVVHLLAPEEEWPLEYHHRKDIAVILKSIISSLNILPSQCSVPVTTFACSDPAALAAALLSEAKGINTGRACPCRRPSFSRFRSSCTGVWLL